MPSPVIVLLILSNLNSFTLMGVDKRRAIRHDRRIPERTLFLSACLFGGLGSVLGMRAFRHKTKHWYFQLGMPSILIVEIVILWLVFYR